MPSVRQCGKNWMIMFIISAPLETLLNLFSGFFYSSTAPGFCCSSRAALSEPSWCAFTPTSIFGFKRRPVCIDSCNLVNKVAYIHSIGWKTFIKRRHAVHKINSLPEASEEQLRNFDDVCAICYQDLTSARITRCNHYFHGVCLRKWLYVQDICPLCHETLYNINDEGNGNDNGYPANGNEEPQHHHQDWDRHLAQESD